jgi:urease accessory protein
MADMSSSLALVRIMTWLSPAFPVGSFAYSGGLERAVEDGYVADDQGLERWVSSLMSHGSLWNDAVFCAEAYRRSRTGEALTELAELADALAGSRERHQELTLLGSAFLQAARAWPTDVLDALPSHCPYPVSVGAVAGAHDIGLEQAVAAFLNAAVGQLVSVAIRCGVLGQTKGVALIARLEDRMIASARKAAFSSLDDLGSATILADISSLKHETQVTRLFRS